jgi:hypothetical protein
MYRQALRELRTRYDALLMDYEQLEGLRAGLARLRGTRHAAQAARLESAMATCRDRAREFAWFLGVARKLKVSLGELTEERRAALEAEHWVTKLREQAASDFQATGRISAGTWSAIASLPAALKDPILLDAVNKPSRLVEEWFARDPGIPEPDEIPEAEVRALIERTVPCR